MRSLRAIRQPQTPSFTRSPSACEGKCLVGFLSHSRICSLRSFAMALIAMVDIIIRLGNSLIIITWTGEYARPTHLPLLLLRGRWQHTVQAQIHCGCAVVVGPRAGQDQAEPGARSLFSTESFRALRQLRIVHFR